MKKTVGFIVLVLALVAGYFTWDVFIAGIRVPEKKYLLIATGSDFNTVKQQLKDQQIIKPGFIFNQLANRLNYPEHIKPGRYLIKNGTSMWTLIRTLKAGQQTAVRLVINKIRTKEDLASKIGLQFEADSTEAIRFLLSNDSLRPYGLDTNTVMTVIIPNSYLFWWNGSFRKIFERLKSQHDLFWEGSRTAKAKKLGLRTEEVYTIASIVEEETNKAEDKGKIASVYLNRIKKGMKLEADPTVKYAMRNFGLKRIMNSHLSYPSPYNTYYRSGIPPGPICTASISSIDAVLDAPETDYLFFVAKPDFNGYSNFASNYADHLKYARAYQLALDSLIIRKAAQEKLKNQ
jgi:UPF0755 protein